MRTESCGTFCKHNLNFPKRAYGGVWNGKIIWGKLQHGRVLGLLSNPCYAGAYVFGRYRGAKSISTDGQIQSKVQKQPIDSWLVLIQEHHPGYINWDGLFGKSADARTEPDQHT